MTEENQSIASNVAILLESALRYDPTSTVKTGLDLFSKAQTFTSGRDLDIIATECLFIAALDNDPILTKAYQDNRRQSCSPNTPVINSANPVEALAQKLSAMQRAADYKNKPEAEAAIRTMVNKARKAFPSIILKVEVGNGSLAVTTRLKSHAAACPVNFGKAYLNDLGSLMVKAETSLLDWCEHQALRLRIHEVVIIQVVNTTTLQKRPYKGRKEVFGKRAKAMPQPMGKAA